jgi:hypothetical protein
MSQWYDSLTSGTDPLRKYDAVTFFGDNVLLKENRQFDPCLVTVAFSAAYSVFQTYKQRHDDWADMTVAEMSSKLYNMDIALGKMSVEDVMNSRASTSSGNNIGLGNFKQTTIKSKTQKKEVSEVQQSWEKRRLNNRNKDTVNQTSVCYRTMTQYMKHAMTGQKKTVNDIHQYLNDAFEVAPPMSEKNLYPNTEEMMKYPSILSPYIWHAILEMAPMIRRMTHKDQLGEREISIMNAAMRIVAYAIEVIARHIKSVEHENGLTEDMIEVKNKDEMFTKMFEDYMRLKEQGKMEQRKRKEAGLMDMSYVTAFDNADCSKWGPGQSMPAMFVTLGLRVADKSLLALLRRLLTMFSNKVFKLPDIFYDYVMNSNDEIAGTTIKKIEGESPADEELRREACGGDTARVAKKLLKLNYVMEDKKYIEGRKNGKQVYNGIVNLNKQILLSFAGMGQGLLGVTSSVLGTDALRLASEMLKRRWYHIGFRTDFVCTSDDYARAMFFQKWNDSMDDTPQQVLIDSVSVVMLVGAAHSIERNEYKSTLSSVVMEINSAFHSDSSKNIADVKSVVSYCDFGDSRVPYENYQRAIRQGENFRRMEGSTVRAEWITMINIYLALKQNQNVDMLFALGKDINFIPIELGGIPKINVMKSICSHHQYCFLDNYSLWNNETDMALSLDIIRDINDTNMSEDNASDYEVGYSRTGMVSSIMRPSRGQREISEYLRAMKPEVFSTLKYKTGGRCILSCLMANSQREQAESSVGDSKNKFYRATTPTDLPHYIVNSGLIRSLIPELVAYDLKYKDYVYDGPDLNYKGTIDTVKPMFEEKSAEISEGTTTTTTTTTTTMETTHVDTKKIDEAPLTQEDLDKMAKERNRRSEALVSRRQLQRAALLWLKMRRVAKYDSDYIYFGDYLIKRTITPDKVSAAQTLMRQYQQFMAGVSNITSIVPVRRYPKKLTITSHFMASGFAREEMTKFDKKFKPVALGGSNTEVHPYIYLSVNIAVRNRLTDWETRVQNVYITLPKGRDPDPDLKLNMLHSSFMENGCLLFEYVNVGLSKEDKLEGLETVAADINNRASSLQQSWVRSWTDVNNYYTSDYRHRAAVSQSLQLIYQYTKEQQKKLDMYIASGDESLLKFVQGGHQIVEYINTGNRKLLRGLSITASVNNKIVEINNKYYKKKVDVSEFKPEEMIDFFSSHKEKALNGKMTTLDVSEMIKTLLSPSCTTAKSRESLKFICNFMAGVSKRLFTRMKLLKESDPNMLQHTSPFIIKLDKVRALDHSILTQRKPDEKVTYHQNLDAFGGWTMTECIIKRGKTYHHYITTFGYSIPVESQLEDLLHDKYKYLSYDNNIAVVEFYSMYGTVFLNMPENGFHPICKLCDDMLTYKTTIVVESTNLDFSDNETDVLLKELILRSTLTFETAYPEQAFNLELDSEGSSGSDDFDDSPNLEWGFDISMDSEDYLEEPPDTGPSIEDIGLDVPTGDYGVQDSGKDVVSSDASGDDSYEQGDMCEQEYREQQDNDDEEDENTIADKSNEWDTKIHQTMVSNYIRIHKELPVKTKVTIPGRSTPLTINVVKCTTTVILPHFEGMPEHDSCTATNDFRSVLHFLMERILGYNLTAFDYKWLLTYLWNLKIISVSANEHLDFKF